MKKLFVIIAIILVIGTLASATSNLSYLKKEEKPDDAPEIDAPEIVSENMRMAAAPILYRPNGSVGQGICFDLMVDPELYEEVIASQDNEFGIMIAPVENFVAVSNEVSAHGKSWHEAFEDVGFTPSAVSKTETIEERDELGKLLYIRVRYLFNSIGFSNVNTEYSAIGYVCTSNGDEPKYTYAVFENKATVITSARSLAYLAAKVLDEAAASGAELPEGGINAGKTILGWSVNKTLGLNSPEDVGNKYKVNFALNGSSFKLSKGSSLKLTGVCTPSPSFSFAQFMVSSDSSVATVSSDGLVKAIAPGTATVTLYSAGATATITVTVE